jgi:pilus assembly protein CpaC
MLRNLISIFLLTLTLLANLAHADHKVKPLQTYPTLRSALASLFPHEEVNVKLAKHTILLTGIASNAEVAEKVEKLALQYSAGAKILNFMKIKTCQQVLLKVKIAEVDRKDVEILQSGKGIDVDHLTQQGLLRLLAEPNLVALSGEQAEFESTASIPVKDDKEKTDYKTYGVKVKFTPTVLAPNRIRLNVEPKLSDLSNYEKDPSLPSITKRKAKTTIELAPGESFMIAGLIQDFYKNDKRDAKEVVISVTPYLVDPIHNKNLKSPTDNIYIHNNLEEKFIDNISTQHNIDRNTNKLHGPVGYMVE